MANDLNFEDKKLTIVDIIGTKSLPAVVRIHDEAKPMDDDYAALRFKIPGKTEVLLQNHLKVKYCHIKILNYYDNDVVQKEKGPEYVLEHDTYVGEEFLIPVKYHGNVKFVHRPGSWKRYTSIAQVIAELPRFIRLAEDTVALPLNGIGKNTIVSAKSTLEVVRKFKQSHDTATHLECRDGKVSYAFSANERINCTEVEDTKVYNLFELVRFKMLPKVILFQNVAPQDIILMDNELNSAMSTGVEGPIELLGFVDIDVIVGWVRDKEEKTYQTVLIPRMLWNVLLFQERSLHGKEEKRNYIKRKYPRCQDTGFIEKSLYMMSMDQSQVTWLRSPEFYVRTLSGMHMFEPIQKDFPESSDDEVGEDYIEIPEEPPPLPERHPVAHNNVHGHGGHDKVQNRVHEKKSLFHKVHKELLGLLLHKDKIGSQHDKRSQQTHKTPQIPERRKRRFIQNQSETSKNSNHNASTPGSFSSSTSTNVDSPQISADSEANQVCGPQSEEDEEQHDYDYPEVNRVTALFRAATRRRPLPELPPSSETISPTRCLGPLSTTPVRDMSNSSASTTTTATPEVPVSVPTEREGQYVKLSMKQAEHLFRDNLTEKDFYNYSVLEIAHCFQHCGLGDLASMCHENRLDGSFFRNFDLNELKKDPFNLTNFKVLKVRKMIQDGWRPNFKN